MLVLKREIYAGSVALLGVSHKNTLVDGSNLANKMGELRLFDEALR